MTPTLCPSASSVVFRAACRSVLVGAALVALAGCSTSPTTLSAEVTGGPQLNPDVRKRPSPVMVRVYELKSTNAFDAADFVSLFEKEQAVLGAELVAREEFVLRPGEKRALTKTLSPDTKFVGVLAAFRELERTRWHVTVPVVAGKKNEVTILLGDTVVDAVRTRPKMK